MMPFFNRNWAGACGGRWAEPRVMLNRSTGRASPGLGFDCCCADRQILDAALPARRTRRKKGRRGLRPWLLRCLSQILSEREERMLGLLCIGVPFSGGAALYL